MEQLLHSYNKAIDSLRRGYYDEAGKLLEQVKLKIPNHSQVKWALGLVKVMTGYPHKALQEWEGISAEEIPHIFSSQDNVKQKLSLYEQLYGIYNRAVASVKDRQYHEAYNIFKKLLSYKMEVPLPADFYKGYLLSAVLIGEEEAALRESANFPEYIQHLAAISDIKKKLEQKLMTDVGEKSNRNSRIKKIAYGAGLAASILIGAFSMKFIDETNTDIAVSKQPVALNEGSTSESSKYKERVVELEETVNDLKGQQEQLQADLENQELKLGEQKKIQELLNTANVDVSSLVDRAGLVAYEKGLQAFKNEQFQEAAAYFKQSQSVKLTDYFSDDALFYLIQSKKKLNETDDLFELYDTFLAETTSNFRTSPYYDDILLEKAEMLVVSGKITETMPLLEKIQQDYPNEWTALRSKKIAREIVEEEDANN